MSSMNCFWFTGTSTPPAPSTISQSLIKLLGMLIRPRSISTPAQRAAKSGETGGTNLYTSSRVRSVPIPASRMTVTRLAGIGTDRTLDEVYKFVPPVSPDLAARWAGVEIDLGRINMPSSLINDWLIVEGAGGVLVPINQKQFMLDLMVKFKLPVVVAARSALGTVNHTLLTLAALHAAELPVHGVVLIGDQNRENR